MYNKIVATLVLLAMVSMLGSAGHAQYYIRSYSAPGGYAYGHSTYTDGSSSFNVAYFGQWQGPVFQRPAARTPSYFNFAYAAQPIQAPIFQSVQYSPSSYNFQFNPTQFQPTYGQGFSAGSFNVNLAPHFQPTYGSGGLGIGGINLNVGPRQMPFGSSLSLGPYSYSYRSYAMPVYATPSRALFNTEFHYSSFAGPYWY